MTRLHLTTKQRQAINRATRRTLLNTITEALGILMTILFFLSVFAILTGLCLLTFVPGLIGVAGWLLFGGLFSMLVTGPLMNM